MDDFASFVGDQPTTQAARHDFLSHAVAYFNRGASPNDKFVVHVLLLIEEHDITFGGPNGRLRLGNDGGHHRFQVKLGANSPTDVVQQLEAMAFFFEVGSGSFELN